ncbi:uncharacterized protein [Typha latifolia]|uniref:uncharacterized protein isoform X2 n=1 Tax=Typha latifolia TaxID=4733 RepID=UPI003C2CB5AC
MNNNLGGSAGISTNSQPNPFGNAFYGSGSGLIRSGLGAYGEKFLGSSSEFMQSNITEYLSDPQYYFQVNGQYVRNKLKVILFPFLHRGHWTRITEPVGGRLSYKPPIHDINAPDLYIPLMAFGSYVVLAGFALGVFGSGEAPLLDLVAYAGYGFAGISLAILARIIWSFSYYFLLPWMCVCMGVFLVKTMKRVLLGGTRSYEKHPSRNHYFLLFMAAVQFPLLFWLSNIGR